MNYENLLIEKKEYAYLKRIISASEYSSDTESKKSLKKLGEELSKSKVLENTEIPTDIIRINSLVTVSSEKGWSKTLQIVIPKEKNLIANKISILTPMGSALIGYSKGDEIIWDLPGGKQNLRIIDVVQGEQFDENNI
ncbi:MAG: GreA/GreB family elongation factor [Flavobacterium sp.]|nr:GreA/GreB family elongation factor [Flavobacterium sp.]